MPGRSQWGNPLRGRSERSPRDFRHGQNDQSVTVLQEEAGTRRAAGPLPQPPLPQSQWQAPKCPGQLGTKVRATKLVEVAVVRFTHLSGWAMSRSSFGRESFSLECYSLIKEALSDDLW